MRKSSRGFTLIELMIVVLIIGTLVSLIGYSYSNIRNRMRKTACRQNMRIIHQAAVLCVTENQKYEKGLDVTKLFNMQYLKDIPRCPSGGRYAIQYETSDIRVTCFHTEFQTGHGDVRESRDL
ncbi:MAG: prepilin-type N-terminal cleavage/methylation domain-containing protein [Candidatus Riflebacteria bacterium]|nr:prepilin-type N-terminal cleavage/methylation domain-containing protein [Candidatus Riflebacteria bacterium]